jgi:hypothetical protein
MIFGRGPRSQDNPLVWRIADSGGRGVSTLDTEQGFWGAGAIPKPFYLWMAFQAAAAAYGTYDSAATCPDGRG